MIFFSPEHREFIEHQIEVSASRRRKLLIRMLQEQIEAACERFSPQFPEDYVRKRLASEGIDLEFLSESIEFLEILVHEPTIKACDLCCECDLGSDLGKKIYLIFRDDILEESRRRAYFALSTLDDNDHLSPIGDRAMKLIRSRYLQQLSVVETCKAMGITKSNFSAIDNRIRKFLPAIRLIAPRRAVRK
jgi:hypothetical protein